MPDPITRERLKKKVLDRWENEGGKICTEVESSSPDKPPGEDKAEQTSESPMLDLPKRDKT